MKRAILAAIRLYQRTKWVFFVEKSCRFTPQCSEYAYQAIDRYGIIRGLIFGLGRILRCHPWSQGGYEPLQ